MNYPLPNNEEERLAALDRFYDTASIPTRGFERVARLARHLFVVSRAAVSLVGPEHQRIEAAVGWDIEQIDRAHSFDAHAILDDEVLVVENMAHDDRFSGNPLVTDSPGIRFYAGAPLTLPGDLRIGTLCIADETPRSFSETDRHLLRTLAALATDLLDGRQSRPQGKESSSPAARNPPRRTEEIDPRGIEAPYVEPGHEEKPPPGPVPRNGVDPAPARTDARRDPLTGLPNRAVLRNAVQTLIEAGEGGLNALLYLDLDRFKLVNDSLGHSRGDQLLQEVATLLRDAVRDDDLVARIGGDEFAVCLSDLQGPEAARTIARQIDDTLSRPLELHEQVVYTPGSIGVVIGLSGYDTVEAALRDADTAMNEAKGKVHQPYVVYEPSMTRRVEERLSLDTELRQAVEREEFVPFFHPIVNLEDGSLKGVEVLARWRHPERGILSPRVFLSATEVTGLIIPIGHQVVEQACEVASRLLTQRDRSFSLTLNANFSRVEFFRAETHSLLTRIFEAHAIQPSDFTMEISERTVEGISDNDQSAIYDLKDLGVDIVLDDFGTGFSSLQSLRRLPVDGLKIDKELLEGTEHGDWDSDLVDLVITMGHTLNKTVTAEGIETTEQLAALREAGCAYGQGFLFAPPVSARDLESLIDQTPWQQLWSS